LKPQYYFQTDENNEFVQMDYYLSFHEINNHFLKLCKILDKEYDLRDVHGYMKGDKKKVLEIILKDEKLKQRIASLYKNDINFLAESESLFARLG